MKKLIKSIPVVGPFAQKIYRTLATLTTSFPGSKEYWEQRYQRGGNSGAGSYNNLAEFKANVLNNFVKSQNIEKVIEYGCGDGNQLRLAKYASYIGFDVSRNAITRCNSMFAEDQTKTFKLMSEYNEEIAQLTLSLDVIYHLIEDEVFSDYMKRLFSSSSQFVIIYSSNCDGEQYAKAPYIRHRKFTEWVEENYPEWALFQHIPNKYPYIEHDYKKESFADFYIYHIENQ